MFFGCDLAKIDFHNIKIMIVGVLAIQGSFEEHKLALVKMNIDVCEVRTKKDLEKCDALIMPGGESTTIDKLLKIYGLNKEIISRVKGRMPIYGTCAGAILLAKKIEDNHGVEGLKLMDISISRNAYGRQLDSFETEIDFEGQKAEAVFIRAPKILQTGVGVEILAKYNNEPVLVRQNNMLAGTFHPELTNGKAIYEYFLAMIADK